jgi:hypothetical protein
LPARLLAGAMELRRGDGRILAEGGDMGLGQEARQLDTLRIFRASVV